MHATELAGWIATGGGVIIALAVLLLIFVNVYESIEGQGSVSPKIYSITIPVVVSAIGLELFDLLFFVIAAKVQG